MLIVMQVSAKARWMEKRARSEKLRTAPRVDVITTSSDGGDQQQAAGIPVADSGASVAAGDQGSPLVDITLTAGAESNPLVSEDEEISTWWRGQARFNVDD